MKEIVLRETERGFWYEIEAIVLFKILLQWLSIYSWHRTWMTTRCLNWFRVEMTIVMELDVAVEKIGNIYVEQVSRTDSQEEWNQYSENNNFLLSVSPALEDLLSSNLLEKSLRMISVLLVYTTCFSFLPAKKSKPLLNTFSPSIIVCSCGKSIITQSNPFSYSQRPQNWRI